MELTKEDIEKAAKLLWVAEQCGCMATVPQQLLASLIAAARELESRKTLAEEELVTLLTEAMRSADRAFERVGGSTRHHVRDCLIPELERLGLGVVRITSPSEPTNGR